MYTIEGTRLLSRYDRDLTCVEPWGKNALRVRISRNNGIVENSIGALDVCPEGSAAELHIVDDKNAYIQNGKIKAVFTVTGLAFYNQEGKELTREHWRGAPWHRPTPVGDPICRPAMNFRPLSGRSYRIEYRMDAYEGEKLFGMGQYQDGIFDLKGATLDMRPRNKQACIPFVVSSRGYGFLWNNPAVGKVSFGTNYTTWEAEETEGIDYLIIAGDTPAEIEHSYADATGHAPMMPEYAMGFWQCKLRYKTQDELLSIAREYKRRNLPLKVIVIDFFHWNEFGNWYLDPLYWPDVEGMCRELEEMGVKLAVSVWPTVNRNSENWDALYANGFLTEQRGGLPYTIDFGGISSAIDATNPAARKFVWEILKKNYIDKGVTLFWLDCAEPEYNFPDDNYLYSYEAGSADKIGNAYPRDYARMIFDGMKENGVESPLSLIRCAWAGSQKYGALLWSGDIETTWKSMREQVIAGQHVAMAGLPWWTTDIGGFIGGDRADPSFRELLLRWFEWMTFSPVLRMHGDRHGEREEGKTPPNEIWSYGEDAYKIMKAHIEKREEMRPYIRETMQEAHAQGDPVIRPLFYEFPQDAQAWNTPFEYMFGAKYLVAPVTAPGVTELNVYLPSGAGWRDIRDGKVYKGGRTYTLPAPIESIPVLERV